MEAYQSGMAYPSHSYGSMAADLYLPVDAQGGFPLIFAERSALDLSGHGLASGAAILCSEVSPGAIPMLQPYMLHVSSAAATNASSSFGLQVGPSDC